MIDAESMRIKQELATRRAERESRLHTSYGLDDMDPLALPSLAASQADPRAEHSTSRA